MDAWGRRFVLGDGTQSWWRSDLSTVAERRIKQPRRHNLYRYLWHLITAVHESRSQGNGHEVVYTWDIDLSHPQHPPLNNTKTNETNPLTSESTRTHPSLQNWNMTINAAIADGIPTPSPTPSAILSDRVRPVSTATRASASQHEHTRCRSKN